jgi:hypothetical protein
VLSEHVALLHPFGPFLPGEPRGVEGDMADEVEGVVVATHLFGEFAEEDSRGGQFREDRLLPVGVTQHGEAAFAVNDSAVNVMGDDKLKVIATELITQVRKSTTIDWTLREGARAKIRVIVKRILNKYGYPPDLQEEAVKTVLRQAELLCAEWA